MKQLLLVIFIFTINKVFCAKPRLDPLVLINQGLIRGQKATDGSYSIFLGLPYAQINSDDPFGPALSHSGFRNEIFNAYNGSVVCPQIETSTSTCSCHQKQTVQSLDCLRLNIFSPNTASSRNPLPVLVSIHGGRFEEGSAATEGVRNLVKHDIVVVTINYRLGVYGFMCLDSPLVPGNQGLKDQHLALKWIRNNIAAFGGNPYQVTLMGEDAGAVSVLLHLYSAKEKLYNKIIAISSTPQSENMFVNGDTNVIFQLAENLGLNTTETEVALDFLAKTPNELVVGAAKDLGLLLKPCKEKSFSGVENFVEFYPYNLSNKNKVRNTPILIGHTNKEFLNVIRESDDNIYNTDPFYTKIKNNFNISEKDLKEAVDIVRRFYIGDMTVSAEVKSELEDFYSDFVINHPAQRTITNLLNENANPVYEYLFSYVGNSNEAAARHGSEVKYLFEITENNEEFTEIDQLVINRITTLWANFIKYGKPTPVTNDLVPVTWEPLNESKRPYLVIDSEVSLHNRVYNERIAFWDLFYSMYEKYNYLTKECKI